MPFILSKRGTHNIHKYESMVNFMGNFVEIENQNNTSVKFRMNQIDRIFFFFFCLFKGHFGCGTLRTITQSWQECKLGNYITDKPEFNQLMM